MTSLNDAIRNALFRHALQTTAKGIVDALAQQGIQVDERVVRQVGFKLLKKTTEARVRKVSWPGQTPAVRCPQGFPKQ
jgi:hypothetical protein